MEQEYELQAEPAKHHNLYFVGLAAFMTASFALAVWAYVTLALAR